MTDPLDLLISRYLDGTASPDEVRQLDDRLRDDPEARRALVLAAAQDTLLRECLADAAAPESKARGRRRRWASLRRGDVAEGG